MKSSWTLRAVLVTALLLAGTAAVTALTGAPVDQARADVAWVGTTPMPAEELTVPVYRRARRDPHPELTPETFARALGATDHGRVRGGTARGADWTSRTARPAEGEVAASFQRTGCTQRVSDPADLVAAGQRAAAALGVPASAYRWTVAHDSEGRARAAGLAVVDGAVLPGSVLLVSVDVQGRFCEVLLDDQSLERTGRTLRLASAASVFARIRRTSGEDLAGDYASAGLWLGEVEPGRDDLVAPAWVFETREGKAVVSGGSLAARPQAWPGGSVQAPR